MARRPRNALRGPVITVVVALLVVNVTFIALDLLAGESTSYPSVLRVNQEWGIPESIMYVTWLVLAGIMVWLGRSAPIYRLWAVVFAYLLVDDAFAIHERVTAKLGEWVPFDRWLGLPLSAETLLQPVYMLGVATLVLFALWRVGRKAGPRAWRYTKEAIVLLGVFAFFAGVLDAVFSVVARGVHLASVVENGGETVVATLILAHALAHATQLQRTARAPGPLAATPAGPDVDARAVDPPGRRERRGTAP